MSSLYAAGTQGPMGIHYTALQQEERGGEGGGAALVALVDGGEIERVTKPWRRKHENWKAKEVKSQNDEGKERMRRERRRKEEERQGGWRETPFFEGCAQLHLITCEGQQRCSFPMATFKAPIYTDQQRLITLFSFPPLSHKHMHASSPRPFLSSHLKLSKRKRTNGKSRADAQTRL